MTGLEQMPLDGMDDAEQQWGVLINEAGVFASGGDGAAWWADQWVRYSPLGRITTLAQSIGGGTYHWAFDTRADSDFAREHMTDHGIHPSHTKVTTIAAARATVHRSHIKYRQRGPSCPRCIISTPTDPDEH